MISSGINHICRLVVPLRIATYHAGTRNNAARLIHMTISNTILPCGVVTGFLGIRNGTTRRSYYCPHAIMINDPNIVRLDGLYLIMDLIDGFDLWI